MKRMELDGVWKGRGVAPNGEEICFDGQVPGCVHTDLLRIGAIDDPMRGKNAEQCSWIEHTDWTYTRTFTLDETPNERAYLAFDGLDTYASQAIGKLTELGIVPVIWDTDSHFYSRTTYKIVNESDRKVIREYSDKLKANLEAQQ